MYIGKAKNIRQRVYSNLMKGQLRSHTFKRKLIRAGFADDNLTTKTYLASYCYVQFILEPDPRERTLLEHYLIAALLPKFND
jgi:excinuclease UvrABC nuclease subunit